MKNFCKFCNKPLSANNMNGFCRTHRNRSPFRKKQKALYKETDKYKAQAKKYYDLKFPRTKVEKQCPICGTIFYTSNSIKKYCSHKCCEKANYLNRDKIQKQEHHKARLKTDPAYKIKIRVRERIREALKYGKVPNHKGYSKTALVGCNALIHSRPT